MAVPIEHLEAPALPAAVDDRPDEDVLFPGLPDDAALSKLGQSITERQAKHRLKAAALLALQQQGYSRREISRMLGMSVNAVRMALNRARKAGRLNDLRNILEHDSLALAIEGLNHHLRLKDKDAIFKHLEGMGQWRSYQHNKHDGVPPGGMPALQVVVQVQAGAPVVESVPLGTPRED